MRTVYAPLQTTKKPENIKNQIKAFSGPSYNGGVTMVYSYQINDYCKLYDVLSTYVSMKYLVYSTQSSLKYFGINSA